MKFQVTKIIDDNTFIIDHVIDKEEIKETYKMMYNQTKDDVTP